MARIGRFVVPDLPIKSRGAAIGASGRSSPTPIMNSTATSWVRPAPSVSDPDTRDPRADGPNSEALNGNYAGVTVIRNPP